MIDALRRRICDRLTVDPERKALLEEAMRQNAEALAKHLSARLSEDDVCRAVAAAAQDELGDGYTCTARIEGGEVVVYATQRASLTSVTTTIEIGAKP